MGKIKTNKKIPRVPVPMTTKKVKQAWKVIKEHNTSAPSGRYNGVYKAMSTHQCLLQQVLTISLNLPFHLGLPFKRFFFMVELLLVDC